MINKYINYFGVIFYTSSYKEELLYHGTIKIFSTSLRHRATREVRDNSHLKIHFETL